MEEVWKNIEEEGFDYYQISNLGRVRIVERDVPTRIVNHGREMIVMAHRKGKYLSPSYDGGRPSVRMMKSTGEKCRRSLPLLVLMHFGEPCPGDIDKYTAGFIDGDVKNTNVNNLMWVSKAQLASIIGKSTTGEDRDYLKKYTNLVFYFGDIIIAYFKDTNEAEIELNRMGFNTTHSSIARSLKEGKIFYHIFDIKLVSDEEYERISMTTEVCNAYVVYKAIMADRHAFRRHPKVVNKVVTKKEIVYKPKIVEKIVYRDRVVKVKDEKPKKEKKVLVNDSTTNVKKTKSKTIKTVKQKHKIDKLSDIDDKEFYLEQEQLKRDRFREELMKRLNIHTD